MGGFFAKDGIEVCRVENGSELLESLRQQSLLLWEESLGERRYRMLPTVQEYGAEKLGKKARGLRLNHAQHFLEILQRAADQMAGKEHRALITRITADLDNMRSGMETAIRIHNHQMVVQYSLAFGDYLRMRAQFSEAVLRAQQGLEAAEALNDKQFIACCQNNLGKAYNSLPTGNRGTNVQNAIACHETALKVYTEGDFPADWAATQNYLGVAYAGLSTGDRSANVLKAIACYEAALSVCTERDLPEQWARTQQNLGFAFLNPATVDRGANLEKAIPCFEAALRVRTETDFPYEWATTKNGLGVAYLLLRTGNRNANLQKAIACWEAALRVYTEPDFAVDWALVQNNLGAAYKELDAGNCGVNLQKAIACRTAALRVYTERDFPMHWAITQNNLGAAYKELDAGNCGVNLQKAIACFEAALRGFEVCGLTEEASRVKQLLARLRKQVNQRV